VAPSPRNLEKGLSMLVYQLIVFGLLPSTCLVAAKRSIRVGNAISILSLRRIWDVFDTIITLLSPENG